MSSYLPVIPTDPHYEFSCTLNEQQYTFEFRWNSRDGEEGKGAWYFDMSDSDGRLVIAGVKVVLGTFLGRKSAHPFFQENVLYAIDTTLTNVDPTLDDLGTRIFIKHMSVTEYIGSLYPESV